MRRFRIKNLKLECEKIQSFVPNRVNISTVIFGKKFNILVKASDEVKKGQEILEKNGQKILSPVCGKVLSIKLDNDINGELCHYIEIEKNEKNEEEIYAKSPVSSKQDLISLCENFGLISTHNFVSEILKNFDRNLFINAFDLPFVFNNFVMLKNHSSEIEKALKKLTKICGFEKIIFCVNKQNKKILKALFFKRKIFNNKAKIVIKTKQNKNGLTLYDLFNIDRALSGKPQTQTLVSVLGGALKKGGVLLAPVGTRFSSLIDFLGGFKQNVEEIEDFKYMSLVAFNDEQQLKQKIKQAKTVEDKQKLTNLLNEKSKQAYDNIFSKLEIFHKKYLNCLSACLINGKNSKMFTKNFDLQVEFETFSLSFLSFEEFN